MRGPGGEYVAHGLHEDLDERHYGQGGQTCLSFDLIFGDVHLRADLATRVRIAAAAMTLLAASLGLFVLGKHSQAIPTLQKENDGGEKNRCDASALHAHSVPDSRSGQPAHPQGLCTYARRCNAVSNPAFLWITACWTVSNQGRSSTSCVSILASIASSAGHLQTMGAPSTGCLPVRRRTLSFPSTLSQRIPCEVIDRRQHS